MHAPDSDIGEMSHQTSPFSGKEIMKREQVETNSLQWSSGGMMHNLGINGRNLPRMQDKLQNLLGVGELVLAHAKQVRLRDARECHCAVEFDSVDNPSEMSVCSESELSHLCPELV